MKIYNNKDFVSEQSNMISDLNEYSPQLDKIEKANEVGEKLLNHINKNVAQFDFEAFDEIDVKKIKEDLKIKNNELIPEEFLTVIYKEIEDSYYSKGRVSLSEYLFQSNVLYTGMMNELIGNVDYTIEYSEEQLKKREEEAAERYRMLLSFNFIIENKDNFNVSPEGALLIDKYSEYLETIRFNKKDFGLDIDDKLHVLGYSLLALENLGKVGCSLEKPIELNASISEQMKGIMIELSEYRNDASITRSFDSLTSLVNNLIERPSTFSDVFDEAFNKLNIVKESVYENEYVDENVQKIQFGE